MKRISQKDRRTKRFPLTAAPALLYNTNVHNSQGGIFMTDNIPFSAEELAGLSGRTKEIVKKTGKFLAKASISSIDRKEGHANFVTDMDVKIQEMLVSGLQPLLPKASFLLEESEEQPDMSDLVWIIDPIDGTQNFICRNRQSAISVGLAYQGKAIMGIVYNPFLDELFSAVSGQGAFLNDEPIHASTKPLADAVVSVGTSPYYEHLHQKTIRAITALYPLCADLRRFGSAALEICYTACGRIDGFFEYRLSPWDYAGASVIVQEAGGKISSIEYEDFDCTRKSGIAAGGQNMFAALKALL